jgi:hypothetical protein
MSDIAGAKQLGDDQVGTPTGTVWRAVAVSAVATGAVATWLPNGVVRIRPVLPTTVVGALTSSLNGLYRFVRDLRSEPAGSPCALASVI